MTQLILANMLLGIDFERMYETLDMVREKWWMFALCVLAMMLIEKGTKTYIEKKYSKEGVR